MGPILWCVAAGGGTTLGAVLLTVWRRPSDRAYDLALGASAGIMLAATVLGLIPAAAEAGTFGQLAVGFVAGVALVAWLDNVLPHWHARFREGKARDDRARFIDADDAELAEAPVDRAPEEFSEPQRRAFLLAGAISLHNFPEGMAVGIAFAGGGTELGIALSIAILVHNIPEGLAVGLPMRVMGMGLGRTVAWTTVTGLVEIAGALLAYFVGTAVEGLLPWGLAFAAGAMLYVVVDEMIPAAHTRGEQRASVVFLAAFLGMTAVIELLGGFISQG
jgi:zinc transporter, ZIP family